MFPMDFGEFLCATGHAAIQSLIERRFAECQPLGEPLAPFDALFYSGDLRLTGGGKMGDGGIVAGNGFRRDGEHRENLEQQVSHLLSA